MKCVLISIRPQWCELIAADMKTEELRKSKPNLDLPFKCYIYQTKQKWLYNLLVRFDRLRTAQILADGLCKVIGEFVCDEIKPVHFNSLEKETICQLAVGNGDAEWYRGSCVSYKEAYRYLRGSKKAYAWHISDLQIYDKPKPLWNFLKCGAPSPNELDEELCSYCEQTEWGERRCYGTPTGPVMCEGSFCGEAYDLYLDENYALKRPPQSWCYVEEPNGQSDDQK